MDDHARLLALDALRSASWWFAKMELDEDCAYANGDDGRTDGKQASDDAADILPKIDAAIASLELYNANEIERLRKVEAAAIEWRRSLEDDNWAKEAIEDNFCRPGMGDILRLVSVPRS